MKNKFYSVLLALVLCMGAFFVPMEVHAQGGPDTEETEEIPQAASASTDPDAEREPVPFTPGGQATVVDEATGEDGKLFYTFSTPEGNVFYLVIDRQRDSDNVYFLNAVTEQDLLSLAEGGEEGTGESAIPEIKVCMCRERCREGWADVSCPACMEDPGSCKGKDAEAPAQEGQEEGGQKPAGETGGASTGTFVFILLAAVAVGGAGYYLKIYKPKHDLDDAEDLDELLGEDAPEVNEDEADGDSAGSDRIGRDAPWNQDGQEPENSTPENHTSESGEAAAPGEDTVLYDDYPEDDLSDNPDDSTWEG